MTPPATSASRVPDVAISLIRTWVPIGVGGVLTWLAASNGWVVSESTTLTVGIFATTGCAATYYALARAFEAVRGTAPLSRMARSLGRYMLGGLLSKPVYVTPAEYAVIAKTTRAPL